MYIFLLSNTLYFLRNYNTAPLTEVKYIVLLIYNHFKDPIVLDVLYQFIV